MVCATAIEERRIVDLRPKLAAARQRLAAVETRERVLPGIAVGSGFFPFGLLAARFTCESPWPVAAILFASSGAGRHVRDRRIGELAM